MTLVKTLPAIELFFGEFITLAGILGSQQTAVNGGYDTHSGYAQNQIPAQQNLFGMISTRSCFTSRAGGLSPPLTQDRKSVV